jgi:predicted NBD/HSP70 family sugar kinase
MDQDSSYTSSMYLGVDVGGTKTLLAVLSNEGEVIERLKFPTPQDYSEFIGKLQATFAQLEHQEFIAACVAIPGRLDRLKGLALQLGNLPWSNAPVRDDLSAALGLPVSIENDANLAGLSEAMLHKDVAKVLYLTVSTGIGGGVVYNQMLEPFLIDSEPGHILIEYNGVPTKWERFASGKVLYDTYQRKAMDIGPEETAIWKEVAHKLVLGFFANMALLQPDMIIIGGSIGTYFDRYSSYLIEELSSLASDLVPLPKIVQAGRPEEAVVYGCYDLAKQLHGQA